MNYVYFSPMYMCWSDVKLSHSFTMIQRVIVSNGYYYKFSSYCRSVTQRHIFISGSCK
jgi:hypothetical protein